MTDSDLLALNALQEASTQPDDGIAAIHRIVKNRMALRFFSDGTVTGTVLRKDQFSWAYFHMADGRYIRVCDTPEQAMARAETLLLAVRATPMFAKCVAIGEQVMSGTYPGGADYARLSNRAVMYDNPKITPEMPAWATRANFECTIGAHDFYRGGGHG